MKPKSITFEEWKKKQLRDPEFRKAYLESKPEYDLLRKVIRARIDRKKHKQLA